MLVPSYCGLGDLRLSRPLILGQHVYKLLLCFDLTVVLRGSTVCFDWTPIGKHWSTLPKS